MNERILVVDDEKAIADLVGIYLTKEGFDVQIAYSGADAAKAILEQEFDLALLDVMLPEKRGNEILAALRGSGEDLVPNTRIIVLTNFEQDDESRMAMEHNVDAYLFKAEITPRKLLEVIASLG